jgi:heme/copper-type cytochrome/quinol oxidase subunit 2
LRGSRTTRRYRVTVLTVSNNDFRLLRQSCGDQETRSFSIKYTLSAFVLFVAASTLYAALHARESEQSVQTTQQVQTAQQVTRTLTISSVLIKDKIKHKEAHKPQTDRI